MNVTVAICTWNRADLLDRTLTGLRDLRVPPGLQWEVVVVNNNCSDHTDAVVARHGGSLPLRCVNEPTPGLSHARNRAIAESTGDLIVFADDDVLVDTEWLAEYAAAADRFPNAGVFGGTIDPWFATEPPRWVRRHFGRIEAIYAVRQLGPDVRPLAPGEELYGASIAFRRAAIPGLRFDPAFGRNRGEMLHGEETDLTARVLASGWGGVWVGTAKLRHFIPAKRTTAAYVRSYYAGVGRTKQRRDGAPATDVPLLFGMPRWMVRRFVSERVRAAVRSPLRDEAWFDSLRTSAMLWGRMTECRAMAKQAALVPSPWEGGGLGWGSLRAGTFTPTLPPQGGGGQKSRKGVPA